MARSYKSADARTTGKPPAKVAVPPVVKEEVVGVAKTAPDRCFQPGDIVSFRSNSRGTVLAVNGDGVQVDFGLGSSWFIKDVLTLIKAASNT
jgi:hypothetical protein